MKRILHTPFLFILAASLLLGSCQLGKHYTRPDLHMPEQLDDKNVDTASIADYPWEQLYKDTTLQALIRKSLLYNKDMLIAAARVKELAAIKRIDFANMFPQINARVYAEKEADNYGGHKYNPDNQFDLKGVVSWELDLWGNLRWARDRSMAQFLGSIENQRALKENEIAFLTGEYPHDIQRAVLPEDVILPASLPIGLPSTLLERRPDVRSAEQSLIAANAEVGMAFTNLFPRITLTAHLGAESEELKDLLSSPYHLLSGTLLQPLFAMGKNRANLKAKKAAYEQAVYSYEKAVLNAFKDARNAIVAFNKTKEIYDTRLRLEQASKSALDLAQLQYINGVIGYMDLLDAQRGYLDAQISLSNAVRDKQISMVNLYKALGGGWKE